MCPDHWNQNSEMRKPAPGMFFKATEEFNIRMDRCLYVGDDERDCIARYNAGCGIVYLSNDKKKPNVSRNIQHFFMSNTLTNSCNQIINTYDLWKNKDAKCN